MAAAAAASSSSASTSARSGLIYTGQQPLLSAPHAAASAAAVSAAAAAQPWHGGAGRGGGAAPWNADHLGRGRGLMTYMPSPGDARPHTVTLIPGDGIGPEMTSSVIAVVEALKAPIVWERHDELSGAAADGSPPTVVPPEILESIRRNKVCLKGTLFTPLSKKNTSTQSLNVQLRKDLDLVVNLVRVSLFWSLVLVSFLVSFLVSLFFSLRPALRLFCALVAVAAALFRASLALVLPIPAPARRRPLTATPRNARLKTELTNQTTK